MKEISYNKLVRDNIIDQIKSTGKTANYKILNNDEFLKELNQKLLEEINEFMESNAIEELADVFEVILKIIDVNKISLKEIEKVRKNRKREDGGFEKKIYLINVIENRE